MIANHNYDMQVSCTFWKNGQEVLSKVDGENANIQNVAEKALLDEIGSTACSHPGR